MARRFPSIPSVLLGLVCANYVEAYDFTAKNEDDVVIYYNYNGAIAIVTSGEQQYEGTVRIPATVTNDGITYEVKLIGPKAFFNCGALTSVEIPSSVVAIGSFAFYFCLSLKSIDIPGNVMAIGDRAFAECQNMETIRLSEGLLSIGAWAFENNLKVQSVCIPASVTEIGVSAFSGNNAMTTVSVAQGNSFFDSRDDCNAIIETASNMLITGCKTTKIPSDIVTIGNCSFSDCETLASIEIPASVTTIGSSAFSHCQSLESIECTAIFSGIERVLLEVSFRYGTAGNECATFVGEFEDKEELKDWLADTEKAAKICEEKLIEIRCDSFYEYFFK